MPERPYPDVEPLPKLPALERAVIERWDAERTFEASVEARPLDDEFVFYDGPPFANGTPHYGHLLTGFVKDAVPRYRTMKGQRVERRFGWDCHGLPVEMQAEKELEVTGRQSILALGVDEFNDHCRSIVGTTADIWGSYVTRSARWVDMANDYKTMDISFMESVMWAMKTLWDKGLLYEGFRVLPYCWECETPLSNFETRMDDAYRERQDPALTVWFELEDGRRLLVWTTTPWTLPSNLAIAVGPDIDYDVYDVLDEDGVTRQYLVGQTRATAYEKELGNGTPAGTVKGAELAGLRYRPLFDYFADRAERGAFRILVADFVTTEDGTGAVHIAPGFGEDDQKVSEANGIAVVCPVDEHGQFTAEVPDYAGLQVFDANPIVVRDLKARGQVVRHDSYVHSYPHCWRTDTPLIYKAVSSWFVKVSALKDRMLELNQEITWVPEHVRDGSFGKWLEGARDWSISRNRFWGSPIPVWQSDDPTYPRTDVYGSLDELERDFGVRPDDLHRPAIDRLTRPNPDDPTGRSTMRRVEDVLDCWFESGSMPFAQVHYPFENQEWFESHFPGDFIVEYIGQTRGWFYTLHVLATALFDKPAFSSCVVHGVLLGNDGQKLSKRLKNYPDPVEVFDTLGSDAMRWALLSSPAVRGGDMVADKRPMEEARRQVLMPIWNAWHFLSLYANAAGVSGAGSFSSEHVLDRYVAAKLHDLVVDLTARMDAYDLSGSCATVQSFLDSLTNWYIRRSRDRFWAGDPEAVATLHAVLEVLCQAVAPLLPLLSDHIYAGLSATNPSVHLTDWPDPSTIPADGGLVAAMDAARDVCSAAASIRKAAGRNNRQPLATLTVAGVTPDAIARFGELIRAEVNVKALEQGRLADVADERVEVNLKVVGRTLGKDTPKVVAAMKAGAYEFDAAGGTLTVAGHTFTGDQFTRRLVPHDESAARALPGEAGVVRLDLTLTPELESEGLARLLVRLVNNARRDERLHVSDRIHLVIDALHHTDVIEAVTTHHDMIAREVLAHDIVLGERLAEYHRVELGDGRVVHLGFTVTKPR